MALANGSAFARSRAVLNGSHVVRVDAPSRLLVFLMRYTQCAAVEERCRRRRRRALFGVRDLLFFRFAKQPYLYTLIIRVRTRRVCVFADRLVP